MRIIERAREGSQSASLTLFPKVRLVDFHSYSISEDIQVIEDIEFVSDQELTDSIFLGRTYQLVDLQLKNFAKTQSPLYLDFCLSEINHYWMCLQLRAQTAQP